MRYSAPPQRMLSVCVGFCYLVITTMLFASDMAWPLDKHWQMQSSYLVKENGRTLTSPVYTPQNWYSIEMPTTVLTALVKAEVYPDPYVGMNNMKIPDAWEPFNRTHQLSVYSHLPGQRNPWQDPYWFWTRFECPKDVTLGQTIWLHLGAINYRADVWLNGHQVAKAHDLVGMFADWDLPVTSALHRDQGNTLAIKIYPPDDPGVPSPPQLKAFGPFGGNGGPTGNIAKSVTMQCAAGWDWMPAVRDRNMGLWRSVSLTTTGPVDVHPAHIITILTPDHSEASLTLKVDLVNVTPSVQRGICRIHITSPNPKGATFDLERTVILDPHQSQTVVFDSRTDSSLALKEPPLWWPSGYGEQPLYGCEIAFDIEGTESDKESCRFGVRTVDSRVTMVEGWARRDFFVNGQKILLQGGAWVPDMMLNRSPEKCRDELRLIHAANQNIVRIWGGGITPQDTFFKTCDELGLLVWHDFWITGDCQGTWGKGSKDYPYDAEVFLRHARRVVEKYRHHPSVLVWTAGNEGYPRAEIYLPLRDQIVAELDGSRPFIPSSGFKEPPDQWGRSWPDNSPAGTYSGGPYRWVDPTEYYRLVDAGKDWLFKNEVGMPSIPVLETLRKFIPDLTPDVNVPFPLNHTWGYHDACEGNGKYNLYDEALRRRYGEPKNVADYVNKAQLVNAENYRAMFEAVNHEPERTAGLILWKTNPAWPSVIWQLYDWYLCPNAGYYFTKKACESVHVQLNLDDRSISGINQTLKSRDVTFVGRAYSLDMESLWSTETSVTLEPTMAKQIGQVRFPEGQKNQVCFVTLQLLTPAGKLISDNFYWLASENDFRPLQDMKQATITTTATCGQIIQNEQTLQIRVKNPSNTLAFFVRLSVCQNDGDAEVLPSFWSDNYISLLPGQSKDLSVAFPKLHNRKTVHLKLEGYNVTPQNIKMP